MIYSVVAVVGAIAGSVANMLIHRLPRQLPIGMARSKCPRCHATLNGWDLIPIFSFVTSMGRCRHCKAQISGRYLLVELLCVGTSVGLVAYWGLSAPLLYWAIVAYLGLLIFFIDMETQLIPNSLSHTLGITGVFGHALTGSWTTAVMAAVIAGGSMGALSAITQKIYRRPTFGGGDTQLMAALGSVLGWSAAGWSLYVGFIVGGMVTAPLLLFKIKARTDKIAFGPFIILGAVIVIGACLSGYGPTVMIHTVTIPYLPWTQ